MSSTHSLSSIHVTNKTTQIDGIQNNSSVFVRVLEKGKGSEYTVSFLGNRFSVFSQRSLSEGTAFRAMVTIKDGKIFLTPTFSGGENSIQKFSATGADSLLQLQGFLQNLGLAQDSLSLRLVQYFQSSALAFNMGLASKARSIGLKFPGKEHEAAEVALFLEQKGVSANVDTVMEVLGLLYGDGSQENENKRKSDQDMDEGSSQNDCQNNYAQGEVEKEEHDILLKTIFEEGIKVLQKHAGILSFINQNYVHSLHWVILPFEMGNDINGSIRLLLNIEKKITEKAVIFAFVGGKNYEIMVECKGNRADIHAKKYVLHVSSDSKIEKKRMCNILYSCLPQGIHCKVVYADTLLSDALFSGGSAISIVEVDA